MRPISPIVAAVYCVLAFVVGMIVPHSISGPINESPTRSVSKIPIMVPIERLDPENAFRHPQWKTVGVENREYLTFLPTLVNIDKTHPRRKVYLDLGLNSYESSIQWMFDHYPVTFDEIYGFEAVAERFTLPPDWDGRFQGKSEFVMKYIGLEDNTNTVNLLRFLDDLKLTDDDFVVMKMDVEGAEWQLIPALFSNGYFSNIDEFMVEMHYNEPLLQEHGWQGFEHQKEEVIHWMEKLRSANIYAHYWP